MREAGGGSRISKFYVTGGEGGGEALYRTNASCQVFAPGDDTIAIRRPALRVTACRLSSAADILHTLH